METRGRRGRSGDGARSPVPAEPSPPPLASLRQEGAAGRKPVPFGAQRIKRRHRPSLPTPERSADLMGEVLARLGGHGRAREFRVFECYAQVVGDTLRSRTQPERLVGTTLFVRVQSSALGHELTLLRGEILARIAEELGPDLVRELRTRVGAIPPRRPMGES